MSENDKDLEADVWAEELQGYRLQAIHAAEKIRTHQETIDRLVARNHSLHEQLEAAEARADAAEGDARRYRWLRKYCSDGYSGIDFRNMRGDHLMLDAAIDAAIGAAK